MAAHLTARRLVGLALVALLVLLGLRATGAEAGTVQHLLLGLLPLLLPLAVPLLGAALLLRDRALVLLAVVVLAGLAAVLAPAVGARDVAVPDGAARLRVVVANAYVANPDPAAFGRAVRALRPDVLVVPELTADGAAGLRSAGLREDLPHQGTVFAGRTETVGLLSRWPLEDVVVRRGGTRAVVRATVRVGATGVRLLPVHPLPPVGGWEPLWREALDDLAEDVRATDLPVVALGDYNADRDSGPFRAVLSTGLRDAADELGAGLARTFPAVLPLLHLDHVLVRDGRGARLVPVRHTLVDLPGSDHRGVVVDLAVVSVPRAGVGG